MVDKEETGGETSIYEIGYLILPSISEDNLSLVTDKIKKIIAKEGGVEKEGEAPFKYPLAYTMSKTIGASRYVVEDAYLGWMKFEAEPSSVPVIKSLVEKIEEILRFLIVKASHKTEFTFAKARIALEQEENKEDTPIEEAKEQVKEVVVE